MDSRRKFIKTSLLSVGAISANPYFSLADKGTNKLDKFGFISGLAKKEMENDWIGTLKKAAEYGFSELEGGAVSASSPSEFLKVCKDLGIKPIASGTSLAPLSKEPQKFFDEYNELNYKYLVCYWPWMGGAPFKLEDCKKSADLLNELGAKSKQNGLTLFWHNHDKEFQEMEEGLPFDYLMKNTDTNLVSCEMDIYWVKKGGGDPLKMLKKYKGRIPILHIKDMAPGPEQDFACPGSGIIDFAPLFKEAKKQKIEHYIVERDDEPDGIGCLRSSGKYLSNIRF
jgi:sugar phosphate isomerase/epimerase